MNDKIITKLSNQLIIDTKQVENTLKLLADGNTIPFIARYRKEITGLLDEEQIREIDNQYQYQLNLLKRKEDIIRLIREKELLTKELESTILNCSKLVEVEDLYRPFKEKKKTKATEAIKNGLEPFAIWIMNLYPKANLYLEAEKYLNDNIITIDDAIEGARFIIAEKISDNADYRKWIRSFIYNNGILETKIKKNVIDENKTYEMYYNYNEKINYIKSHRLLAVNRGEKEKILNVKILFNNNIVEKYLEDNILCNKDTILKDIIITSIKDSLKRLILPSIEREIRSHLNEKSENSAIDVFCINLEKLLLSRPLKEKVILGFDPAFRTGCKLAIIDKTGKMIDIKVIYPHQPKNELEKSKKTLLEIIENYNIDVIAIGNGTASRESEMFVSEVIKECKTKVEYIIVNEAGASVYSASPLAIKEFPDLHVEERSAISIARRIQDPLSELIKIDTKSIGIGQYQHDLSSKKLNESLEFVVSKAVNQVGVNINTASSTILQYISGLNKKIINNIIEYRNIHGKINNRSEMKKIKGFSEKVYTQSIGFIRIIDGDNLLDKTSIHPESYEKTLQLLELLNININEIGSNKIKKYLDEKKDLKNIKEQLDIDEFTLDDIIKSLKEPLLDPRDKFPQPILKSDVLTLKDLNKGMKLQGTVRNVVDFGVFIDIGLKNDGMAHISKLTDKYIKHPSEIVNVGDIVDCFVEEIFLEKNKVSLTLKEI